MNINEVARQWKHTLAHTEPKWDEYPSTQVTVEMAKRARAEVLARETIGKNIRGNENGN